MDLEKLEKMTRLVLKDLDEELEMRTYRTTRIMFIPQLEARVKNLMSIAQKSLPDYQELFAITHDKVNAKYAQLEISDAISVLEHLLEIIKLEKSSETKIKGMKIFESAEDKLKQANLSFRKDNYTSVFHNLNTALEMVLKDKLGIPITITKINTSNIIDILVKHKVEPYLYLVEVRKHVLLIDNKIKHQGYSPSKIDCINGIKAMEEVISKLRGVEIKLTEEIRNKIYQGL